MPPSLSEFCCRRCGEFGARFILPKDGRLCYACWLTTPDGQMLLIRYVNKLSEGPEDGSLITEGSEQERKHE